MSNHKTIYIIAGEESGDILGGRLMQALNQAGQFDFHGIGGQSMQEQGLPSLFPMTDLSVMGLFEVLPRLPKIMKRINQTVTDIAQKQPDLVITVDSPDFCKRVVKAVRPLCAKTKFIHYVAPTVWAWRQGRAKKMAKLYDGLICLFPFEPQYFEPYGLRADYCGHPIVETITQGQKTRTNDHILILPGSRVGEVKRMAPVFAETFKKMRGMNPSLKAYIVALPHVKDMIDEEFYGMDIDYIAPVDRFEAFKTAPFTLATSGTVGLELAVAECPHIIAYKMNPLTWKVLQHLVHVKFAHLVNIMEGRQVIPECLQSRCNSDDILHAVKTYDCPDLSVIRAKLSGHKDQSPSQQAAKFVQSFL